MDGSDLEFIELKNIGTTTMDLSGLSFTEGILFTFPAGSTLSPGAFAVIASNMAVYYDFYGSSTSYDYSGNLSNGGEKIVLKTGSGRVVFSFTYSDSPPWPVQADGYGYSLISAELNPRGNPDHADYWTVSNNKNGSPMADDVMSALELPALLSDEEINLEVYPNPAKSTIYIGFTLQSDDDIEAGLYDLNGRFLQYLIKGNLPAGRHRRSIQLSSLKIEPGVYLVACKSRSSFTTKKFIYIK
jgi:hypothetical protein